MDDGEFEFFYRLIMACSSSCFLIMWRRTVEKEIKEMGKTWEGIKLMARDRQMWREHVAAIHAT